MTNLMPLRKQRPKKNKDFSTGELSVMKRWAGKKPVDEIVILVNAIGNHLRDKKSVMKKGSLQGLSFRMVKQ